MTQEMIMRHTRQTIFGFCYFLSDASFGAIRSAIRTPSYNWWIREQAAYYGT